MIRRFKSSCIGLLFILLFATTLFAWGQEDRYVQFPSKNLQLLDLIKTLDSQLETPFVYSSDKIPKRSVQLPRKRLYKNEAIAILKAEGIEAVEKEGRFLLTVKNTVGAKRYTISGYVVEKHGGESLIGANLQIDGTNIGISTNRYGYYSLTIPEGEHTLKASFLGYATSEEKIQLNSHINRNFRLKEETSELEEVVISSRAPASNVQGMIPGINAVDFDGDSHIPYFLGEVDVFQSSLLLPGIKTLGEDANGINVRGGGIDENLIILDEAPIYNPNHYFGLVSVFNPEAVNDIQFLKGFFPANYGGRASSVVTVTQKEGNNRHYHFTGGIGLLSARLLAEGPLIKDKSSFLISGRQSLIDPTKLGESGIFRNTETFFTDLNIKVNWKPDNKNTFLFIQLHWR